MATAAEREANLATTKAALNIVSGPRTTSQAHPIPKKIPIIDSHIHLYPASETHTLAWYSADTPAELQGQHSLDEYTADTGELPELEGFIFLETDRVFDLESGEKDGTGWEGPLMEVEWLRRIALGCPKDGEGHSAFHSKLCLGIVPWAPIPSGPEVLARYIEAVEDKCEGAFHKVRGFRYLVQDKPDGTMLRDKFVEGVKWLGREGFAFDLGVDSHRRGEKQMMEAVELIGRVHEGVLAKDKTVFVLNHLCKPDLTIEGDVSQHPDFLSWRESMFQLSKFSHTYMKLSGMFSELPASLKSQAGNAIFERIMPWLIVILATFRGRLMFGSDWPVCTAGVGDEAWKKWRSIIEKMCDLAGFSTEERIMFWSGTAIKAYGIKELM